MMAYCTLLVVQLKYDYFGEITNPIDTLKIRLKDIYTKKRFLQRYENKYKFYS